MRSACSDSSCPAPRKYRVASLFSGIGGFEKGLASAGHQVELFCENNADAQIVLRERFNGIPVHSDVRVLKALPASVDLVTAGFPCQDLSQAGQTAGIFGANSGLVWEVFRLLDASKSASVLFENVPFMLRLNRGAAMQALVDRLEQMGYRWAYRTVDARSFGLPQRRPRVFLFASRENNPCDTLFADNAVEPENDLKGEPSFGFYWTEGNRGIGWAVNALPALKGGSGLGILSAPAIILPNANIVTPHINDAERLQGFPVNWTAPAVTAGGKEGSRWRLVGNAVNVRVARWIGNRLSVPGTFDAGDCPKLASPPWPDAAFNIDGIRRIAPVTRFPVLRKTRPLHEFLRFVPKNLSLRAASGVLGRLKESNLRPEPVLMLSLERHVESMRAQQDFAGAL